MMCFSELILGSFTAPLRIGTNPQSLLWIFPLLLAIAVVYKGLKIAELTWNKFIKETAILFVTLVVSIVLIAIVLHGIAWVITQ
ncbi:MAG: hypothetical protein ABIG61_15940 [Planctomycetota bacterium]